MDVIWTRGHQPGNPYNQDRDNVLLQLTVACLSAGPLGWKCHPIAWPPGSPTLTRQRWQASGMGLGTPTPPRCGRWRGTQAQWQALHGPLKPHSLSNGDPLGSPDGLLMKPSYPATPIDRMYYNTIAGEIWQAHTMVACNTTPAVFYNLLAVSLSSPVALGPLGKACTQAC